MYDNFPYSNFHDLNVDWIINRIKQLLNEWLTYQTNINNSFEDFKTYVNNRLDEQDTEIQKFLETIAPELFQQYVYEWLNDHPEATTTVQDGSISERKFTNELKIKSVENCTIPQIFINGDAEGEDITESLNMALADENSVVVKVPSGTYYVSDTIVVPDDKTLEFEGDYHDPNIKPTVLIPTHGNFSMIQLNSKSGLTGGLFSLGRQENVKAVLLDCHNKGIEQSFIKNSKIIGGRESDGILSQTGVHVECDDLTETTTEIGYLMLCFFDAYIDNVGYAYHFHRQRAEGTTTGVWLTNNDIYGYIRHCTRYVFYDMASGGYANNSSVIGAILQAGSLISGEAQHPGINLKGNDILVSGKCWDFSGVRNYPAVYLESTATKCFVLRDATVVDYGLENNVITQNISINSLVRTNSFKKVNVSLMQTAIDNNYISNLTNKSYRIGDVIYINLKFKIASNIPQYQGIFNIDEDAFDDPYQTQIYKESDCLNYGGVFIPQANPHGIYTLVAMNASNTWMHLRCTVFSNRINTFTL